ncbi:palmitoyltransferase [Acrasis kona]|uniref:Palmitoyltransferase n=1 Tax=Acrasis kona TaxID=1008807 RepID=A0AAW2YZL4_9EUKA
MTTNSIIPERSNNAIVQKLSKEGKHTALRTILANKENSRHADEVDSNGFTPLMNAIIQDQYECVRVLLEGKYCNPNARSMKEGVTPLGMVALSPHLKYITMISRILVSHGALVSSLQQGDKYNLVHLATSTGNITMVQYLLSLDDTVHLVDDYCAYGYTPLHYSIMMRPFEFFHQKFSESDLLENYVNCAKALIRYGCDVKKKTRDGKRDAMSICVEFKNKFPAPVLE